MALRYGYFDSEIIGTDFEGMPIFDRAETSDLFALLFASLVSDGVLALPSTCFQVRGPGDGMGIELSPGFGMVKGHFCYSDEITRLKMEPAPLVHSRIDRVVMRCNYLDRMVEIIIKVGEEAEDPIPPDLIRPQAGDYYELCLANVRLEAGQKVITQSSITDTRPDSAVCGYITQLIDHLDTEVFFDQLNAFYQEFVDKSNTSYEQFVKMAENACRTYTEYVDKLRQDSTAAYNNLVNAMYNFYMSLSKQGEELHDRYNAELDRFLTAIEIKGNAELLAITQQLILFKTTNEKDFLEWFDHIKGILGTDSAGALQSRVDMLNAQVEDLKSMLINGMVQTRLKTDQGDFITDSTGKPLLIGWPICGCNKIKKEDQKNE